MIIPQQVAYVEAHADEITREMVIGHPSTRTCRATSWTGHRPALEGMAQVFNRAIPLPYSGVGHHRDDWYSKLSLCLVVHVKPEPARNSRGQRAQDYCLIFPRLRSQ